MKDVSHGSSAPPSPGLSLPPRWKINDAATRAAYDRFAPRFAERYFETRALDGEMDAFLSLLPPSPMLLDAGCGPGHQARYFQSRGAAAIGLDYSLPMLLEGRSRDPSLKLVSGSMLALPFPTGSFHGVWARASLIHMDDRAHRTSLEEFHRVLRPEGLLYAAVRQGTGEEMRRDVQSGVEMDRYFRFWQPEEWESLLQSAGFAILNRGIEAGDPEDWLWVHARRA